MNILINSGRTVPFLTTRRRLIESIIRKGHNVILTGYEKGYEKDIKEMGASFIAVPLNRAGFNPFSDLRLCFRYYRIIKKYQIDVVHSYTIKPNIYGSIAAGIAGLKKIYPTLNGVGFAFSGTGFKARLSNVIASGLYWITFKLSDRVLFHNNDDVDLMVRSRLISRTKCTVTLGSGIDMDFFPKRKPPRDVSFLLISRLLKAKGVFEFLQAARIVKTSYPNLRFQLIGPPDPNPSGIDLDDIQEYIEDNTVNYLGSQKDVRPFLENSMVFVLPSYREGVPHTVLEAMATGRAILTTNVPGCKETVIHGKNGLLVPSTNVEQLADAMLWMIENPERVMSMCEQSYLLAMKSFEVTKTNAIIEKTIGIF